MIDYYGKSPEAPMASLKRYYLGRALKIREIADSQSRVYCTPYKRLSGCQLEPMVRPAPGPSPDERAARTTLVIKVVIRNILVQPPSHAALEDLLEDWR